MEEKLTRVVRQRICGRCNIIDLSEYYLFILRFFKRTPNSSTGCHDNGYLVFVSSELCIVGIHTRHTLSRTMAVLYIAVFWWCRPKPEYVL